MEDDALTLLRRTADRVESLSPAETHRQYLRWIHAYCAPIYGRTGRWIHPDYMWHTFSWGYCPSKSEAEAFDLYRQEYPDDLIVLPEHDEGETGARMFASRGPDLTPLRSDYYVFPASLVWTMAFTHEQPEIGPYFSRLPWVPRGAA